MFYLGSDVSVAKMISELETIYGTIVSSDVLMQNYYKISMDPKELVQAYVTRMEGVLNQIRTKFPHMLGDKDMETHLRDSLFYGIIKALQDSIHHLYDNDKITYGELVIACRKLRLKFEIQNKDHQLPQQKQNLWLPALKPVMSSLV